MENRNLFTSGYLSQMFQRSPSEIEGELDEAGFVPALSINNLPHWPDDVVIYLRRFYRNSLQHKETGK